MSAQRLLHRVRTLFSPDYEALMKRHKAALYLLEQAQNQRDALAARLADIERERDEARAKP